MRIGVDLGGTKIEAIAIDEKGLELTRKRVPTPRGDYAGTVAAVAGLIHDMESTTGQPGSVGIGIPGTVVQATGLVKNANSTWLNGMAFDADLSVALDREVRMANDANCLAVSEAVDGAAQGYDVVFGVILGTGCGGGVALGGRVHSGPNGLGGEWGHTPLPWATAEERAAQPPCYCGKSGCMEQWVSGTGFAADYARVTGKPLRGEEIVALADAGDTDALAALDRLEDRLARGFSVIVNVLDPDVFVIGGGLSRLSRLYENVPRRMRDIPFGGHADVRIVKAVHGDSSGVRGAAWLWNPVSGSV